jgi:hypothetical protein
MDQDMKLNIPIVIYSFSRPAYLEKLLISIKQQKGIRISGNFIHLLQDGAVSPRSGVAYCEQSTIDECVRIFKKHFPGGFVHLAPHNLGIAMNVFRGEELVFRVMDRDIGYFFEDDLELGPHYIAMLERVREEASKYERVGYFAAYGHHRAKSNPQHAKFISLEHHWGFGLKRSCWEAMLPWLSDFFTIWKEVDYKGRPHLRLLECYLSKDVASNQTSQDVARTMACASLGFARINTDVCYARYIGAEGQSFRPESFERNGFHEMNFVEHLPETLAPLSEEFVDSVIASKREFHTRYRNDQLEPYLSGMRAKFFNPDVPVTREDIDALWRLLLDRLPDDEGYYARTIGAKTIRQLRTGLLKSIEARSKSFFLS